MFHHTNCCSPETQGQKPVKGCRGASPLQMSQDQGPGIFLGLFPYFLGYPLTYPPQDHLLPAYLALPAKNIAFFFLGAFSDYNNRIILAVQFIVSNFFTYLINIKNELGDENNICPTWNPGIECYPAGLPPHDFHNHDPIMGFGGWVQLVQGLCSSRYSSIKTKSEICRPKVIVNGFGHSHNRHAEFSETVGNFQTAVPSHSNMTGKAHPLEILENTFWNIPYQSLSRHILHRHGKWISFVGASKNSAPCRGYVLHHFRGQTYQLIKIEQTFIAAAASVHLPSTEMGRLHYSVNNCI